MKLVSVVVVGLAVACGGKQQPEAEPAATVVGNEAPAPEAAPVETVAKRSMPVCDDDDACGMRVMRYFRDEMCVCGSRKDKDCAQRVTDEMTMWAQESAKRASRPAKWSENDSRDMEMVARQLGECTTLAMMPVDDASANNSAPRPASPPQGRQIPVGPPPGPKPVCSSSKQGTTSSCWLDTMTWFADAMCACTMQQCANDLTTDMTKWAQDMAKNSQSQQKTSAADAKKMEAVGKRLGECVADVMMNTP